MKKFVALLAALVMVLSMCACATAESAETVKVTIWHTFTGAQQAALEQFAADFNASQSEYEVIVESQAYSGFTDTVFNANTTIYAHWTSNGDAAPIYSIGLDVSDTHTFDPADVGYGAQTPKNVTVRNTGTGATGPLTVELSG